MVPTEMFLSCRNDEADSSTSIGRTDNFERVTPNMLKIQDAPDPSLQTLLTNLQDRVRVTETRTATVVYWENNGQTQRVEIYTTSNDQVTLPPTDWKYARCSSNAHVATGCTQ